MEHPSTIPDLMDLWRSTPMGRVRGANSAFAHDLGVESVVVRSMRFRNAVDVRHWPAVIASAARHARTAEDAKAAAAFAAINADLLLRLHTRCARAKQKRRSAAA